MIFSWKIIPDSILCSDQCYVTKMKNAGGTLEISKIKAL